MKARVSMPIAAPADAVHDLYADYSRWPEIFPTISGVRLLRRDGTRTVLEVDHQEGLVTNELEIRAGRRIELWECKRRYDAWFRNEFEDLAGGTLFTVVADIRLKGWNRLLRPFVGRLVRRQMTRYQLIPIKRYAERGDEVGH